MVQDSNLMGRASPKVSVGGFLGEDDVGLVAKDHCPITIWRRWGRQVFRVIFFGIECWKLCEYLEGI